MNNPLVENLGPESINFFQRLNALADARYAHWIAGCLSEFKEVESADANFNAQVGAIAVHAGVPWHVATIGLLLVRLQEQDGLCDPLTISPLN